MDMIAILMMPVELAIPGLLKRKVISIHDATNETLSSDPNHVVDVTKVWLF